MVTGDDKGKVITHGRTTGRRFWDARNRLCFCSADGSLTDCLDRALASKKHPFFISDMGDNPTAGGAGDVTWTLNKLFARPEFKPANGPSLIYASIPGPEID